MFEKVGEPALIIRFRDRADVEAQAGAYATGVLVLITSASVAVTLAAKSARQQALTVGFGIIALVFAYLVNHLQPSHMWIAFTGLWGKLLLSPAHHQIHHSTDPAHFDRNLGSSLAVFDWLFGTLHVPARKREKLTFGVDRFHGNPHAFADSLAGPVKVVAQRAAAFLAQPETSRAEP